MPLTPSRGKNQPFLSDAFLRLEVLVSERKDAMQLRIKYENLQLGSTPTARSVEWWQRERVYRRAHPFRGL